MEAGSPEIGTRYQLTFGRPCWRAMCQGRFPLNPPQSTSGLRQDLENPAIGIWAWVSRCGSDRPGALLQAMWWADMVGA